MIISNIGRYCSIKIKVVTFFNVIFQAILRLQEKAVDLKGRGGIQCSLHQ